jgi:hypothetical protein
MTRTDTAAPRRMPPPPPRPAGRARGPACREPRLALAGARLVAAELEARGAASVHVRIDERVAGFTALGIGRESGMPPPSSARPGPRSRTSCRRRSKRTTRACR